MKTREEIIDGAVTLYDIDKMAAEQFLSVVTRFLEIDKIKNDLLLCRTQLKRDHCNECTNKGLPEFECRKCTIAGLLGMWRDI